MSVKNERTNEQAVSFGVEELIDRLRDEGVRQGRSEAERIVADAESRARWLIKQAQGEAENLVAKARSEAKKLTTSADDALQVAARDMLLALRERLTHRFAGEVRRLVGEQLVDKEFLRRLILEVAAKQRKAIEDGDNVEVILPLRALEVDELRKDPGELQEGELSNFVLGVTDSMIRDGIVFRIGDDEQEGITARLVDEEISVEVTAEAVTTLLLEHLQPRFRALLEGVVRG